MKIQKYIEIKDLSEARDDEYICVMFADSSKNYTGKKTDELMKSAIADAKLGKCKLLVWREVDVDTEKHPDFSTFSDTELIDELTKRGYQVSKAAE